MKNIFSNKVDFTPLKVLFSILAISQQYLKNFEPSSIV